MSIFTKKREEKKEIASPYNSQIENELVNDIDNKQLYAESGVRSNIEMEWDDEYKIHIGKQWDTSKGLRTQKGKKRNFNSQDNLVLPMIENAKAPFSSCPEPDISGIEDEDEEIGRVIDDLVTFILYRNKFEEQWEKMYEQMFKYGPIIGYVPFDPHWIGGVGPDRWAGEIRVLFQKKDEFFPDPAILDLEERLQECSYINLKKRKKIEWFREVWPEKGKYVLEDTERLTKGLENEGQDPKQATLIIHFHKGTPKFVSDEWKKEFLRKAEEIESEDPYKAQDYRDMASGTLKGVHCAYKAGSILLDYIPYIYEDGLYPFVYKVLYIDEKQPWGMGLIRNVVIPQILHNKADEIELSAMLAQGLGGGIYNKGAMSNTQKEELLDNAAKVNAWTEVNDKNGIEPRQPVQVPSYITNYKEGKKNIIDVTSMNTAILQGISPGANVPYATIQELGARADAPKRRIAKILERFMIEIIHLIINRIVQFYTVERKYRILGNKQISRIKDEAYKTLVRIANMPQGTPPEQQMQMLIDLLVSIKTQQTKPKSAVFKPEMLVKTWDREVITEENGNSIVKKERFIPEFDIKVRVMDERPTDRNYYSNMALQLFGKAMGLHALWKTLDEGKWPPIDEIIAEVEQMQQAQAQAQAQIIQAQQQLEQQQAEAERQAKLLGQKLTNDTQLKMTAMSAIAKAGAR